MALAMDADGWGLSNEMRCKLLANKSKVCNAVFAIYFTLKLFNQLYITNKMEHFSFKSERVMRVGKFIKEN